MPPPSRKMRSDVSNEIRTETVWFTPPTPAPPRSFTRLQAERLKEMLKQKYSRQKEETDEMERRRNKLEAQMDQVHCRSNSVAYTTAATAAVAAVVAEEHLRCMLMVISNQQTNSHEQGCFHFRS